MTMYVWEELLLFILLCMLFLTRVNLSSCLLCAQECSVAYHKVHVGVYMLIH